MHSDPLAALASQRLATDLATRPELVAALAFVEGAGSWGTRDLAQWFETRLAARQIMPVPVTVKEAGAVVSLASYAPGAMLSDLLSAARGRVVRVISGMLAQPVVDAFLSAAIFSRRVERHSEGGKTGWRATPRTIDSLSDIVLSLFVTDILSHRELYEQKLAVCVTCGRVSFEGGRGGRTGCRQHPLASTSTGDDDESAAGEDLPPILARAPTDRALADVRDGWCEELFGALGARTAWARLGSVEVAAPNGLDTVGGYADKHTVGVPPNRSPAEALLAWRRSGGARLVDRAVIYANNALLLRAPPPKRLEQLGGPWRLSLDASAPTVVLGSAVDCARVARVCDVQMAVAIADVRPGLAVLLSGRGVACWIVADVDVAPSPHGVGVSTLVEVRSRAVSALRRVDISLG